MSYINASTSTSTSTSARLPNTKHIGNGTYMPTCTCKIHGEIERFIEEQTRLQLIIVEGEAKVSRVDSIFRWWSQCISATTCKRRLSSNMHLGIKFFETSPIIALSTAAGFFFFQCPALLLCYAALTVLWLLLCAQVGP